jgi:hypothetical protein
VPPEERELLKRWHPNVLIAGTADAVEAALALLRPDFRAPLIHWRAGGPVTLPPAAPAHTLIVEDVAALTPPEQSRLFAWLQRNNAATQVVATTSMPLLPLVEQGSFSSALYYALNVVYLEVSAL